MKTFEELTVIYNERQKRYQIQTKRDYNFLVTNIYLSYNYARGISILEE